MARKCAEYAISENGNKRCKRFVTVNDSAKGHDDEIIMAKSSDGADLGYFNISEVSDAIGALGGMQVSDILPPLVGGTAAIFGTLFVRKFIKNQSSKVHRFAPALGAGIGVAASIPLYWVYGPKGVVSGALTSVVTGGAIMAFQELKDRPAFNGMGLLNVQRKQLAGPMAYGGGATMKSTARVPAGVGSAMDVKNFGGNSTY